MVRHWITYLLKMYWIILRATWGVKIHNLKLKVCIITVHQGLQRLGLLNNIWVESKLSLIRLLSHLKELNFIHNIWCNNSNIQCSVIVDIYYVALLLWQPVKIYVIYTGCTLLIPVPFALCFVTANYSSNGFYLTIYLVPPY